MPSLHDPAADGERDAATPCPCGAGAPYDACCGPCHRGEPAATPEALMRSRYSAFALRLSDYLLATWDPQTRPERLTLDARARWTRLEILAHERHGERGRVHFRATFAEGRDWGRLEEDSAFRRLEGRWYYRSGEPRLTALRPGRNDPCPCGSGRKFKKCCAS